MWDKKKCLLEKQARSTGDMDKDGHGGGDPDSGILEAALASVSRVMNVTWIPTTESYLTVNTHPVHTWKCVESLETQYPGVRVLNV